MNFPSKLVEDAVNEISRLPGIGKKTALRLALHLLKEDADVTVDLASAIVNLRNNTTYCKHCHTISDAESCSICASGYRDKSIICVVEDVPDLLAIENTGQYRGVYHVLKGVISPLEGIGPSELTIDSLVNRIPGGQVKEVIFALSPSMEGDTTAFYITKRLKEFPIKISSIARGIAIGGELEYTDEITLGRSILTRTIYQAE